MRKNIALILALVMILSMIPMSASAASKNSVNRVVTTGPNDDLRVAFPSLSSLPMLTIEEDGGWGASEVFRLSLPSTARWNAGIEGTTTGAVASIDQIVASDGSTVSAVKINNQVLQVTVTSGASLGGSGVKLWVPMNVKLSDASGEQRVTVDPRDSALSPDSKAFAIAAAGETIVTLGSKGTITRTGSEQATITIDESRVGVLRPGTQEVRLRLPRDFQWETGTQVSTFNLDVTPNALSGDTNQSEVTIGGTNNRDLIINFEINDPSTNRGSISIAPVVSARKDAPLGEVAVAITGLTGQVSNASGLVIGEHKDYGITISVDPEDDDFYAGRYTDDYKVEIEIEETIANSLFTGRKIDFTLPSWVNVISGTTITAEWENATGAGITQNKTIDNRETNTWEIDVPQAASPTSKRELTVEFTFTIDALASGDIVLNINGAGVENEDVVIGQAVPQITVESGDMVIIEAGTQNQAVPEIWITETKAGALREGTGDFLEVYAGGLFEGTYRFDKFDYEVVEGDLVLDDDDTKLVEKSTKIQIGVDEASTEASTIRLYNIEMTLDRTVPKGGFRMDVGGDLVVINGAYGDGDFATRAARISPYFEVGTPLTGEVVTGEAQVSFTVGQMAYTVDGEMQLMDVAAFISDGRLMVPVRYLEELFGMQPVWNPTARTVTVLYENKVFEMTIGSNMLRVNGAPFMEMDAEATIVDARTFVPASRFARAMGIDYVWDAATQTVTFN